MRTEPRDHTNQHVMAKFCLSRRKSIDDAHAAGHTRHARWTGQLVQHVADAAHCCVDRLPSGAAPFGRVTVAGTPHFNEHANPARFHDPRRMTRP